MANTLPQLETQRVQVVQEIAALGDFRRGSITSITGRCGKPNCRCHQPGQPGHGPNFRLTRKVAGKTVSETFSSPAAWQKAQREVAEFHHFQALSDTLVEVNEKICHAGFCASQSRTSGGVRCRLSSLATAGGIKTRP